MAGERTVKIKFTSEVRKFVADTATAGGALARWEKQADRAGAAAGKFSRVTKALIAPGALPAVAALGTALVGVVAAAGAGGAALGVFGAVAASSQKEVSEAATKVEDLTEKIRLNGRQAELAEKHGLEAGKYLKAQSKAALELEARLSLLPAPVREATRQYIGMKSAWDDFVEDNQPATFGILERGYALIGNNLSKLQPLYDIGAAAASRALGALERFATGGGLDRFVAFVKTNAGPALDSLGRIGSNVGSFLGDLFAGTVEDGQGFLEFLADATERLAAFGDNGGLQRLLDSISSNGPGAGEALSQLGAAAVVIAQALGPIAPISIAIATALAGIIAALPPELITALVGAWLAYTVAMAGYNAVMAATAIATNVATVATKAFGLAMRLTPVGLLITGITLIVAGIVLLATKTEFFQKLWAVIWGAIKAAAGAVADWWRTTLVPIFLVAFLSMQVAIKKVQDFFKAAWDKIVAAAKWVYTSYVNYIKLIVAVIMTIVAAAQRVRDGIVDRFNKVVSYISGLKGRISSAAGGLWDGIKNSFRNAINYIIDRWNGLSFSLPSINTPFGKIGGTTLSTPNLPRLASGGWAQPGRTYLTGENGPELLSVGRRAYVSNANDTSAILGESGSPVVHVYIGDRELTDIVDVQIESRDRQTRRRAGARVAGAYA